MDHDTDAAPFTLPELRIIFQMQSTAQEIFISLVGEHLDELVRMNDQSQVWTFVMYFFVTIQARILAEIRTRIGAERNHSCLPTIP